MHSISQWGTCLRFCTPWVGNTHFYHLIYVYWCKEATDIHVNLDEAGELGAFISRTTSFKSIWILATRLIYYYAASTSLLSCLPLQLTLREKSTTQSY